MGALSVTSTLLSVAGRKISPSGPLEGGREGGKESERERERKGKRQS